MSYPIPRHVLLGVLSLCALALLLLAACTPREAAPTAPLPTPTEIVYPPTWTPVLPTPTPLPTPSRTPDATTQSVLAAFDRTAHLSTYGLTMEMGIAGPGVSELKGAAGDELMFMSLAGHAHGKDSRWVIKGWVNAFLTGDANKQFEIITLGGRTYIHGPVAMLGAPADRWYVAPPGTAGSSTNLANDADLAQLFGDLGAALPQFSKTGEEKLDGQRCQVYRGDEGEMTQLFSALAKQNRYGTNWDQFERYGGKMVFEVSICADSYVRRLGLTIEMQQPGTRPLQKMSITVSMRVTDINIIVPIKPPANAVPLPGPFKFPTVSAPLGDDTA